MASIFSKIVSGEIPCYKIAEDMNYLAFLDIQPLVLGHVLVIPKVEVDYIFNCNDELLSGLILFSKKVAKMMEGKFDCKRIGVTVIGLEVPHAHIHLIPINSVQDMDFSKSKLKIEPVELEKIAQLIRE
jgi:histidine triad (HIT) family protein